MGALNQIDTVIIIVVAISSAFGLWRGLVKELLSLLSWIAALLVARVYGEPLARLLVNMIESESIRYVTAFVLLFVMVIIIGTLINHFVAKLLTVTGFKFLDRLLGVVFGLARGTVIVLVILFISNVFVSETEWWQESTLIPYGMVMIEESLIFIGDMNSVSPVQ
ncbi:MAG: colicin V production CvpA [Gammaproteobacteria bacterium]|nr:colicin V production CvpA [Gammaproteobacteria bacterium]